MVDSRESPVFDSTSSSRNAEIAMKLLAERMRRFLQSEDGPTAVEYAVMLALIVIVCLTAITAVGTKSSATFDNVANSLSGS
jgi:pilus assembly protein Flp/PilA